MDLWKLIPIIISSLALIISAATFFYNFLRNRKNLDVELVNYYDVPHNGTFVRLKLINKSSNNISITGLSINGQEVDDNKLKFLKSDPRMNYVKSDLFPQKLESYDSKVVLLLFYGLHFETISKDSYKIYTSRGKVKKKISNQNKLQRYTLLMATDV